MSFFTRLGESHPTCDGFIDFEFIIMHDFAVDYKLIEGDRKLHICSEHDGVALSKVDRHQVMTVD